MKLPSVILGLCISLPLYLAASISGIYEAEGHGPTNDPYTAIVHIDKVSDTVYNILWKFEDGSIDVGTGVRQSDSISFVFYETNRNSSGTQLYSIDSHHTLEGPWVRLGALNNGFEKLKKLEHSH